MRFLCTLALLSLTVSQESTCVDDAPSGWKCVAVESGDTLFSIAHAQHVSPVKLCDMNRNNLEAYNCSLLEVGQLLRVPTGDECVERPGAWSCYDVQDGDTLGKLSTETIGDNLINSAYLASFNKRALWGASDGSLLYAGQQLKMPRYHCIPTRHWDCHVAAEGEDLYSIAAANYINAGLLAEANRATVMPGSDNVWPGVELRIPRTDPSTWTPAGGETESQAAQGWGCTDKPGHSFCYKVKTNDTLWQLSKQFNVPLGTLCMQAPASYYYPASGQEVIGAPNCSRIFDADWISVPIKRSPGTIALGDECEQEPYAPYWSGSNFSDPDVCVAGGVCAVNSDYEFKCQSCSCSDLTPCFNLNYAQNQTLGQCVGLELVNANYYTGPRWACPAQTSLCGDFPSVYPKKAGTSKKAGK